MKGTLLHLGRSISALFLSVGVLIPALVVLGSSTNAYGDLVFYRAIEDREAYAKQPNRYIRIVLPPGSGMNEVYVERVPALTIRLKEIRSISAEQSQADPDAEKMLEELLRSRRKEPYHPKGHPDEYSITFSLTEQGGKKFRGFAQKHDRELFDVRFRAQRVSIGRLLGPFEEDVFGAFVMKDTVIRLKRVFPQLNIK